MLGKPYLMLAVVLVLLGTHGAAALRAYKAGATSEAARWQAQEIKRQQAAAQEAEAMRAQIAAIEADRQKLIQEAADAVAEIRIEYLPSKQEVRRIVVDRPVFRDCRAGDSVLEHLNAALRGRPAAGPAAEPGGDAGLSL
jgi:CRISPR/Cas system-associated endoribonuclease Cas2